MGTTTQRAAAAVALIATIAGGLASAAAPAPAGAAPPSATTRVSVSSAGAQGDAASGMFGGFVDISGDGTVVVFASAASTLAPGDTNGAHDVFARDLETGTTELVSISTSGSAASGNGARVSRDGRYVVFTSGAADLVPGDTNDRGDVFLRDRVAGTTERVSLGGSGGEGNSSSSWPDVSDDGRFVTFASYADNLVPGDTNAVADIFVRDRQSGTTERVSIGDGGAEADGYSQVPNLSADGRYVVFESVATNLVADDTNGLVDVFVHDRSTGTATRVSLTATGGQIEGCCGATAGTMSADGRFVSFVSQSPALSGGTYLQNTYLRDTVAGTTERVSLADDESDPNVGGFPSFNSGVSDDGRYVVFSSWDALVDADTNSTGDVYVRDRQTGATVLVSTAHDGALGNGSSSNVALSGDGSVVAFDSLATNLVPDDTNGVYDVFASAGPGSPPSDPAVFIDDVDVAEGRTGRLIFRFEPALTQTSCFRTRFVDGTASRPSDYTPNPGRICIPAGAHDAVTGIPIVDDGESEPPEDFIVELYDLEHLVAGDTSATWTIVDDPVVVTPGGIGGLELDSGSQIPCVPVHLDAPHPRPTVVDWETVDTGGHGIATAGEDYLAASGRLVIPPGETEGCVEVEVYGDTDLEPILLYGEWLPIHYRTVATSQNVDINTALFFGLGLIIIGEDDW